MSHTAGSDPLEIRVLVALTTGAASAVDVAMRAGAPVELVGPILTQSVAEQLVTQLGRGRTPAYSLTPKGLHAVGVHQGVQGAVDGAGPVDLGAATPVEVPEHDGARDVDLPPVLPTGIGPVSGGLHVERVEVNPARKKVTWRHVVYAAAYVVLGLFFLLLQPVVGVVVIVAGLALGGFALRPLWRSGSVTSD